MSRQTGKKTKRQRKKKDKEKRQRQKDEEIEIQKGKDQKEYSIVMSGQFCTLAMFSHKAGPFLNGCCVSES